MQKYKNIQILLKSDTVDKIEKLVSYSNTKNDLLNTGKRYRTVEDFIIGSVYYNVEQIENPEIISNIKKLGDSTKLKNTLKEYMKHKNITQTQLSEMTGVSQANISNIINNINQPSLDHFFRIWIALECPPLDKIFYREYK